MSGHSASNEGFSVIGRSVPRVDGVEKATGSAVFVNDLSLPGMLHARILRSPYAHARILSIDVEAARRMPGVLAVVSGKDVGAQPYGLIQKDETLFAVDKVRFIGDEVAAVAAVDVDTAEEALGLIEVEYEELPAVFTVHDAVKEGAPLVHGATPGNVAELYHNTRGNPDKGFAEADAIVEVTLDVHSSHAGYMEPRGAIAHFERSGKLSVWSCSQTPYLTRKIIADILKIKPSQVRHIQPYVGGAFGGKTDVNKESAIAAVLSREVGRPVRLVLPRTDDLAFSRPSVSGSFRVKLGARSDGTFTAKETVLLANNGAYSSYAPAVLEVMAARCENLYKFGNLSTHARLVYTNTVPTGAVRGFGNPQGTAPVEMCIDALAEKLGLDPLEVRLKNAIQPGETTVHGWKISTCAFSECLQAVAEKSGYRAKRASAKPNRGIGLGGVIHVCGNRFLGFDGSAAVVRMNEDGRVTVVTGEGELGQGSRTAYAMIAAETLGARYEDVEVTMSDTDYGMFGIGFVASRGVVTGGNAVRVAAEDARQQILRIASELLEANAGDIVLEDGRAHVKGAAAVSVDFASISRASIFRSNGAQILGRGMYDAPSEKVDHATKYGNIAPTYSFGAQAVEVEVDPDTGVVKVLGIWAEEDIGRQINPISSEGQVEGAIAMMFGSSVMEKLEMEGGQVVNANLLDYCMPTMEDMPVMHHGFFETNDSFGPYGAKAMSESPGVPTMGALANAVRAATGVFPSEMPVKPAALLRSLKAGP